MAILEEIRGSGEPDRVDKKPAGTEVERKKNPPDRAPGMKRTYEDEQAVEVMDLLAGLDDALVCRIFEFLAGDPDETTRRRMRNMSSLAATCRRLYAVSHSAEARCSAWSRLDTFAVLRTARESVWSVWTPATATLELPYYADTPICARGRLVCPRTLIVQTVAPAVFADLLEACPCIEKLDVGHRLAVDRDTLPLHSARIGAAIAGYPHLRVLSGEVHPDWLCMLARPSSELAVLDLSSVPLTMDLADAIGGLRCLSTLKVRLPRIADMIDRFKRSPTLEARLPVSDAAPLAAIGNAAGARPLDRLTVAAYQVQGGISEALAGPRFAALARLTVRVLDIGDVRLPASLETSLVRFTCCFGRWGKIAPVLERCRSVERLCLRVSPGYCHEPVQIPLLELRIRPTHVTLEGAVDWLGFVGAIGARMQSLVVSRPFGLANLEMGEAYAMVCPTLSRIVVHGIRDPPDAPPASRLSANRTALITAIAQDILPHLW